MELEDTVGKRLMNNMVNQEYMDIYLWGNIRGEEKKTHLRKQSIVQYENFGRNKLKKYRTM